MRRVSRAMSRRTRSAFTIGSAGSRRRSHSRASAPPGSARRKKAQAPSRCRVARPASTSSRRWRETRGCDWPRMATSSLTVSSAASNRERMRSRVSSPAASRPASRARKASGGTRRSSDISISLCLFCCESSGEHGDRPGGRNPGGAAGSGNPAQTASARLVQARRPTALSGRRSRPINSAKVAATRIMVSAAPEKISPRSVRPKIATGSVTQPGG